jgi:glycosyltransferase involved in cell wall biosynthesis
MIKNLPLVSICIPTYNGSKYIKEAIVSAVSQTYKNIEIIISDDNSKDDTLDIIKFLMSDTNVSYIIYNHKPQGIGENWNNCVRKANGEFIKFLLQDDVLESGCIEKMVNLSVLDSNIGLVYCKRKIIYDSNNDVHLKWLSRNQNLHNKWYKLKVNKFVIEGKEYLKDYNLMREPLNKIGEPTAVLLKKECFDKVGFFNKELKQTLDFEYWYRLMKYFKIGFIEEDLVSFRLHSEQATFINQFKFENEINILYKSMYKNVFWQLHPYRQWKLFKSVSELGDIIRFLKVKMK